eukprot:TRINITY_DN39306_c0_g1_i1.p1 TRINITY_DN39306_c0_g1~~TRINITY_DN39306_c0_g1_i1.p1  ORF type:complete len:727 (+),score=161.50 TRINITY_DN39306_c0_g1_i1:134-2314(+)
MNQDALNDDTFGNDGVVGDDWIPSSAQEAFHKELEHARGSPTSSAGMAIAPPPGLGKPPGLLEPPPAGPAASAREKGSRKGAGKHEGKGRKGGDAKGDAKGGEKGRGKGEQGRGAGAPGLAAPPGGSVFGSLQGPPPRIPGFPGIPPEHLLPPGHPGARPPPFGPFGHPGLPPPGIAPRPGMPPGAPGPPLLPGMPPLLPPYGAGLHRPPLPGHPGPGFPYPPPGSLPGPHGLRPGHFPPGMPPMAAAAAAAAAHAQHAALVAAAHAQAQRPVAEAAAQPPKVLSVAEVEKRMLEGQAEETALHAPSALDADAVPAIPDSLPKSHGLAEGLLPSKVAEEAAIAVLEELYEDDPVELPTMLAPFTDKHREAILSNDENDPWVKRFTRSHRRQRPHAGLMNASDKELIVRIQLNQMAAVGGQALHNYRGTFMHRRRNDTEDPSAKKADVLVTRLQETIEDTDSTDQLDAKEDGKAKFGAGRKNHPRTSIDVSGSGDAGDGEFSSQEVPSAPTTPDGAASGSRSPTQAEKRTNWRWQLSIEKAYEDLMDLEHLTFKILKCTPAEAEKLAKLKEDRSVALERLEGLLLATPGSSSESILYRLIGSHKGRSLVQRVMACLSTMATTEFADSPVAASTPSLLWHLLAYLLQAKPLSRLLQDQEPPSAVVSCCDENRTKLLWTMTRSVEAGRNVVNTAGSGSIRMVSCREFLNNLNASSSVERLCSQNASTRG